MPASEIAAYARDGVAPLAPTFGVDETGLAVLPGVASEVGTLVATLACTAGMPRRSTGRLGSYSSGDDDADGVFDAAVDAFAGSVLSPGVGLELAGADAEEAEGEALSVGRSESSSDFGGALPAAVLLLAEDEPPPAVELD